MELPPAVERLLWDVDPSTVQAIATRGAARDFWDIHELLTRRSVSLSDALRGYAMRDTTDDPGHVVRSLAYFGEAEAEPLPRGLERERWRAIRADVERWVREL